jgi:two-component system chemotaxis sensor kinase CheA
MNEVVREFLLETHENLAQLDLDLLTLEKDPAESETLARVFRTLHTVKGTAGFLGLPKLQAVAHAAENLLSRLRAGELTFNPEIAGGLLASVDAIRRMLDQLEKSAGENEGSDDFSGQIQALERLTKGGSGVTAAVLPPPPPVVPAPAKTLIQEPPAKSDQPTLPPPAAASIANGSQQDFSHTQSIQLFNAAPPVQSSEPRAVAVSDSAVRVDVGLLDKLMTLVGELVLARNQIKQFSGTLENAAFLSSVQRLNLLTGELQTNVMKTRMQPIGNIWNKFSRVVRDLAVACGKQVRLELDGQETELDKTIVEAIRDPLTHMVRNAVDHGIEPPAERVARGKPPEGRLRLHASHQSGKINIEISDDGGGIDPRRVRDKALRNNLLTAEQADRLNEQELLNLVFLPGFSTADKVTQFSGRGVGLDVVKTNIEKIGGMVAIESKLGQGTSIKMRIPLTLAIIPALIVTSGGDRYAIPQVSLLELVRLEDDQAGRGIEMIANAPVYRLRGNLLPLIYLSRELQIDAAARVAENSDSVNIVVLQAGERPFGLIVDGIRDSEEIVVKTLQKQIKGLGPFAGATIMGDGKVALILDVLDLAQRAQVLSSARERIQVEETATANEVDNRESVLLFATRDGDRLAIPLASAERLEEFPSSALEWTGRLRVAQYRGEIMPLLDVAELLGQMGANPNGNGHLWQASTRREANDHETVPVVVHHGFHGRVGLLVDRILDIVEEPIVTRVRANRPGVLFNAVIQGKVTEFLDLDQIIAALEPSETEMPEALDTGV